MQLSNNRRQRVPQVFAPDPRPSAEEFVYCKGCGQPLEGQTRRQEHRAVVAVMMCEPCRARHGHQLIPESGEPSFCYRCGGPDEIFIELCFSPVTYHVCPRCIPERAARYRAGNFELQEPVPPAPPPNATVTAK
ncbi:MAG: hypothetical protein M3Z66_16305 [Chloroflexota bacterium]|nr:hypothetical protein [Chloroflexota bacterium]